MEQPRPWKTAWLAPALSMSTSVSLQNIAEYDNKFAVCFPSRDGSQEKMKWNSNKLPPTVSSRKNFVGGYCCMWYI